MECGFVFGDVLIDLALDIDCDFGRIQTSRERERDCSL